MSPSTDSADIRTVRVELGLRSYDILIGPGALGRISDWLAPLLGRPRAFVLTDETVQRLHRPRLDAAAGTGGIRLDWHALAPGEASKTFSRLEGVLDWLLAAGADRGDVLIALGGGVTGDMGGLAACLMKRGMGFIQIPTTLLAQVDSSVGGKTAVNTPRGKNLIGAFYQPQLVIADTALLETLPPRELRAGYAEIVKYGLINDRDFFDWLDVNGHRILAFDHSAVAHAVARSCAAKAAIVAADETETGQRQLLNLGHTFAHALEAANGYRPDLLHGEAVAIGMVLALSYSEALGLCPAGEADRARRVLAGAGLPVSLAGRDRETFAPGRLAELMRQDKKGRAGRLPLILVRRIGAAFVYPDADLASVEAFLETELARSD